HELPPLLPLPPTPELSTLSLHDALPICPDGTPELALEAAHSARRVLHARDATGREIGRTLWDRVSGVTNVRIHAHARAVSLTVQDRKSTRLNSSHEWISYAVFCLKKKNK